MNYSLLVDKSIAYVMRLMLQKRGFYVDVKHDGFDALQVFQSIPKHLI